MSAASVSDPDIRPLLVDAVELARRALVELEPSGVGAHLGVDFEDETAATHRFEATLPGYRGWQWAVVVAAAPAAGYATVSESALLPGPDALVAPAFVPWEQRVRPGDLAPGDLLAPPRNDPRLTPGYVATGDPVVDEVAFEVGLGRTQVLSLEGRAEAAERWYTEFGPDTEMAKAAPATCGLCGFFLPLAGALQTAFGVCGNAMGADGHVVHNEYGCGAHSDTVAPTGGGSPMYEAYDDAAVEMVEVRGADSTTKTTAGTHADSTSTAEQSDSSESIPVDDSTVSANATPDSGADYAESPAAPDAVPSATVDGDTDSRASQGASGASSVSVAPDASADPSEGAPAAVSERTVEAATAAEVPTRWPSDFVDTTDAVGAADASASAADAATAGESASSAPVSANENAEAAQVFGSAGGFAVPAHAPGTAEEQTDDSAAGEVGNVPDTGAGPDPDRTEAPRATGSGAWPEFESSPRN